VRLARCQAHTQSGKLLARERTQSSLALCSNPARGCRAWTLFSSHLLGTWAATWRCSPCRLQATRTPIMCRNRAPCLGVLCLCTTSRRALRLPATAGVRYAPRERVSCLSYRPCYGEETCRWAEKKKKKKAPTIQRGRKERAYPSTIRLSVRPDSVRLHVKKKHQTHVDRSHHHDLAAETAAIRSYQPAPGRSSPYTPLCRQRGVPERRAGMSTPRIQLLAQAAARLAVLTSGLRAAARGIALHLARNHPPSADCGAVRRIPL